MKIKRSSLSIVGIFSLAMLISCSESKKQEAPVLQENEPEVIVINADAASIAAVAPNIAYVNIDSLQEKYIYFADVRKKLEAKSKSIQQQTEAKSRAFQEEVEQAQRAAQMMTPQQQQELGNSLQQKDQELAAWYQKVTQDAAKQEMEENEKLQKRISLFMKKYARENGYTMIVSYAENNSLILYVDPSMEVTTAVLSGLNAEYKAEKKGK